MAATPISTLSTESTDVARIVAAHNAASQIIDFYRSEDEPEAQADRYVRLFNTIGKGITPQQGLPKAG